MVLIDWSRTLWVEAAGVEIAFKQFADSQNQSELYKSWFGKAMPTNFSAPTKADIAAFQAMMNQVAVAFQQPYASTKQELPAIQAKIARLNPVVQRSLPSLSSINEAREEVAIERVRLLKMIGDGRHG